MFGLVFSSANAKCLSVEQRNPLILQAKDDRFTELGEVFIDSSAINTKSSKSLI